MELGLLQSFYADIKAARIARVPVELTSRSLLQAVATPSESKIDSFASLANQNDPSIDPRHQAAIATYSKLGSMVPALEGLSTRAIARQEFSHAIRRALWYLALVLLVALLGLLYFRAYIAPEYELVRQDIRDHYHITDFNFDTFPYLIPMTVLVAVLLFLNMLILFTNKTGFLLRWFGGKKYVRLKVSSAAANTLALMASQDIPLSEAVQTTATLYALDATGRRELSKSMGDNTSPDTCRNFNQYWSLRAARTLERTKAIVPMVLLTIIGGGIATGYGLIVYGSLVGLLRDLVEAGIAS